MSLEVGSLRALAHPVRLQILSLLTGTQLSATEIAQEIGISQANASYHLRQLLSVGQVEVVEERRIRGGVAKIYRHPYENHPQATAEGTSADRLFWQALATELSRRSGLRRERTRGSSTDAELWVDAELWKEVLATAAELSRRLHDAAKPPGTEGTLRTSTTIAMFEMEPKR
jgi:DNA-binding transcriptional ArsR family regulator